MVERSVGSGWCWMFAAGALGLGCDALPGAGKEPAPVTAEAEAKVDAKDERTAAGGEAEAKVDAKDERTAAGGEAKVAGEDAGKGAAVEPSKAVAAGDAVDPSKAVAAGDVVDPSKAVAAGDAVDPSKAVAPGTPAEPGVVAPTAPGTPLPALAFVPPSEAALTEKMQRRLRSKLREQHDARTQLASSLALPQPDGGVVVLALYEYSEYEACVGKSDGSPEARKACANPTDDNERVLAGLRKCTGRGLVRARFGPSPASAPAYGGELVVEATRPLAGGCTVAKVRGFSFGDVDGDGQPELAVDVVTKTPQTTFRTVTPYDVFARTVGWYRADLAPQYEAALCEWFTASIEEGNETVARRIRLEDADGDGRSDLRIESVEYVNDGDCDLDEVGWLKTAGTGTASYDDACAGKVETATWRYDPGKDEWIDPASSSSR